MPTQPRDWQETERVVGLIEKALAPGARVAVNQKLPNRKTGHEEQCDVTITQGIPPRQTLSIVEVQQRQKKVDVNDYRGWCKKREDVGAQHLICVSEKGFPTSIVDDARLQGDTVRLLTLSELEGEDRPFQIIDNSVVFAGVSHRITSLFADTGSKEANTRIKGSHKLFKREGVDGLLSAEQLVGEALQDRKELQFLKDGVHQLKLTYVPPPEKPLDLIWQFKLYPVNSLTIGVRFEMTRTPLPLTHSEYSQTDYEGALAYALTAEGQVEDCRVSAKLIFVPENNGLIRFAGIQIDGLPQDRLQEFVIIPAKFPGPSGEKN